MNWDAIGAIGEIVGASAVFVSLVYLASQIRIQNREARAASVHEFMRDFSAAISRLIDPEMADIAVMAVEDFDSLSPSQRLRLVVHLTASVRVFEDGYFQWREGRLENDIWTSLLTSLTDLKSTQAFARFWKIRRHQFRSEFADYIDSLETGKFTF